MENLKQNTLNDSTTDLGFVQAINTNLEASGSEAKISFQREVELEDGTIVTVESITPEKMKSVLNDNAVIMGGTGIINAKTPGEIVQVYDYPDKISPVETTMINGVVQIANNTEYYEPVEDAEEVMDIFNDIEGTQSDYNGMGGTEEEIEAILDNILGN